MHYRPIAIQVGDLLKYDTTINSINRMALSVFNFECEDFPTDSITSDRAKLIYNWILTLAKQEMKNNERNEKLKQF